MMRTSETGHLRAPCPRGMSVCTKRTPSSTWSADVRVGTALRAFAHPTEPWRSRRHADSAGPSPIFGVGRSVGPGSGARAIRRGGGRCHLPFFSVPMNEVSLFHPAVADWFDHSFAAPTAALAQAWPAFQAGRHVLIAAPTGSGKTLAAFLAAI